jgi:hypothetical protein
MCIRDRIKTIHMTFLVDGEWSNAILISILVLV